MRVLVIAMMMGLTACSPATPVPDMNALVQQAAATMLAITAEAGPTPRTTYTLIDKTGGAPGKCVLEIQIADIVSRQELTELATYIRQRDGKSCAPLFVRYLLLGQKAGTDPAWAGSDFAPDLDLQINGLTVEAKATYAAVTPTGLGVLGKWLDTWMSTRTITLRRNGEASWEYLERCSNKHVEYILIEISSAEAAGEIANDFQCSAGSPIMLFTEILLDETQTIPMAFSLSYFNHEVLSFRLLTGRG